MQLFVKYQTMIYVQNFDIKKIIMYSEAGSGAMLGIPFAYM